jgi:hypothetical protein
MKVLIEIRKISAKEALSSLGYCDGQRSNSSEKAK